MQVIRKHLRNLGPCERGRRRKNGRQVSGGSTIHLKIYDENSRRAPGENMLPKDQAGRAIGCVDTYSMMSGPVMSSHHAPYLIRMPHAPI